MAALDEIGREKQRISERLAQLDAERTKLSDQLNDLETAARVLKRFGGQADTTKGRRGGHSAGTTLATPAKNRAQGGQQPPSVLLSDASLSAAADLLVTEPGRNQLGGFPFAPGERGCLG